MSNTAGDYQVDGVERVVTLYLAGSTATTACFIVESTEWATSVRPSHTATGRIAEGGP